jgi:MATE family multidrug resistance protein
MVVKYIYLYLGIVSLVFVGHLDDRLYLDAAALGNMFFNISAQSVGFGLASGMDTLCSQAYGGKQVKMIGVYLQRGILIMSLICVPCFFLNYHVDTILVWLGQQPGILFWLLFLPYCSLFMSFSMFTLFWLMLCHCYRGSQIISSILSMDSARFTIYITI